MIATGYTSLLVALRRAGYVATNAAASSATGSLANALIELRSLS